MQQLSVKNRLYLKGLAHALQVVVTVGNAGVTDNVIKEIDASLKAHELIKIKVTNDDREYRESIIEQICNATNSLFVQHIGKLLIIYRRNQVAKITLPEIH